MHRLFVRLLTCLHFISANRNQGSSIILVTRLRTGRLWIRGSIPYNRTECFLPRFMPAVGPLSLPSSGYWRVFTRDYSGRAINPTSHLHLVSKLRMHGGIPPPLLASAWHVASLSARRTLLEHFVTIIVRLLDQHIGLLISRMVLYRKGCANFAKRVGI